MRVTEESRRLMTPRRLTRRIEYLEELSLPQKDPPVHRLIVMSAADDTLLRVIDFPAIEKRGHRQRGQRYQDPGR